MRRPQRPPVPQTVAKVDGPQAHILIECLHAQSKGSLYSDYYDGAWYRACRTHVNARLALQEAGLVRIEQDDLSDSRTRRIVLLRPLTPPELEHVRAKVLTWKWDHSKRCPMCRTRYALRVAQCDCYPKETPCAS